MKFKKKMETQMALGELVFANFSSSSQFQDLFKAELAKETDEFVKANIQQLLGKK